MIDEMTCKELVELVTDYLEGTLTESVRLEVESHLSGCSGCTNYMEQMRQTVKLTGRLKEEHLSPGQRDELLKMFQGWKKP